MKQELSKPGIQNASITRYAYFLYLLLVAFQLFTGSIEWAITNFGIALVFDPFSASGKWQERPVYQKVWLFVHLALFAAGLSYLAIH